MGKKKLEKGIAAYKAAHSSSEDTFSVHWLPFYLNPDAPKQGIDKQATYESKFGKKRTASMQQRLSSIGKEVGINFKYGGKTGNTRDSHRLIQLAKTQGFETQNSVVAALFAAYFENEQDITNHAVLKEAGIQGGLDPVEVEDLLKTDKCSDTVDKEVEIAMANIVTGVPNFTIGGKYEVRGAQDAEGFKQIFEAIKSGRV